jgi:arginase
MCRLGQSKPGVEYGGFTILSQLRKTTKINEHHIQFFSKQGYFDTYKHISNNLRKNRFNFNLGGDHSIAASTIQPLLDYYQGNVLVVWIDAHADINTYDSSETKNTHGMPVAGLIGLAKTNQSVFGIPSKYQLKPENLLYYGLRSIDNSEHNILNSLNIKSHNPNIIELIKKSKIPRIHISFDVDSIKPELIPSTGTPVNNGIEIHEVLDIIDAAKDRLVSFDLVEFNPGIGSEEDVKRSLYYINEVICRALS